MRSIEQVTASSVSRQIFFNRASWVGWHTIRYALTSASLIVFLFILAAGQFHHQRQPDQCIQQVGLCLHKASQTGSRCAEADLDLIARVCRLMPIPYSE